MACSTNWCEPLVEHLSKSCKVIPACVTLLTHSSFDNITMCLVAMYSPAIRLAVFNKVEMKNKNMQKLDYDCNGCMTQKQMVATLFAAGQDIFHSPVELCVDDEHLHVS